MKKRRYTTYPYCMLLTFPFGYTCLVCSVSIKQKFTSFCITIEYKSYEDFDTCLVSVKAFKNLLHYSRFALSHVPNERMESAVAGLRIGTCDR